MSVRTLIRILPLAVLCCGLILFYYFELYAYIKIDMLKTHHQFLMQWRTEHAFFAFGIFALIYISMVACSIPGIAVLNITSGFLFGIWVGAIFIILSDLCGSSVSYFTARTALAGDYLNKFERIKKIETGFRKNAFYYLLGLRLLPIFPYWIVNIASGTCNIRWRVFVAATFLGIIPMTLVYATLGHKLESLF